MGIKVDSKRWREKELWEECCSTGVYVRAQTPEKWETVDIVFLTKESLENWLRKHNKDELIRLVKILLQHEE